MNGPFLSERDIGGYLLTATIAHDELIRALVLACLVTLARRTPRRHRMRVALPGAAFATTVRMIDRVHRGAANGRAHTAPATRTGLTELLQVVLGVADFA